MITGLMLTVYREAEDSIWDRFPILAIVTELKAEARLFKPFADSSVVVCVCSDC